MYCVTPFLWTTFRVNAKFAFDHTYAVQNRSALCVLEKFVQAFCYSDKERSVCCAGACLVLYIRCRAPTWSIVLLSFIQLSGNLWKKLNRESYKINILLSTKCLWLFCRSTRTVEKPRRCVKQIEHLKGSKTKTKFRCFSIPTPPLSQPHPPEKIATNLRIQKPIAQKTPSIPEATRSYPIFWVDSESRIASNEPERVIWVGEYDSVFRWPGPNRTDIVIIHSIQFWPRIPRLGSGSINGPSYGDIFKLVVECIFPLENRQMAIFIFPS